MLFRALALLGDWCLKETDAHFSAEDRYIPQELCEMDLFEYLRDVLDRVSTHPANTIAELTPSGWKRHLIACN